MDLTDIAGWDVEALEQLAGGLEGVLVAYRVRDLRRRLDSLCKEAAADELQIRDDGSVSAVAPITEGHPLHVHAAMLSAAARELIGEALLVSADLHHATSVTSRVGTDLRDKAVRINEEWRGFTAARRHEMVLRAPDLIANLDGIPSSVRSAVNLRRTQAERARLQDDSVRISQELHREFFGGRLSNTGAGMWYAQRKLEDLDAIDELLHEQPERKLVLMDMRSGERGFAAVAIGDPDTADHIAVTIPGLNTNVKDSLRGMVSEATRLRDEARRQLEHIGRDESVAAIAWIGYDAPQIIGPGKFDIGRASFDVSRSSKAGIAADALGSFFHGLRAASSQSDVHITALGHSYGSLATSLALQRGASASVDDVVFYGSPGVRAKVEADLGVEDRHVYVMKAEGDSIAGFGRFGGDPTRTEFQRLSTAEGITPDGVKHERAFGHAEYARTGDNGELRMAGYNLAVVVAGLPERAVQA
ncbi:alpha/beta hydrolase [Rhodococcus sp. IEGM 1379]|uniref:alpha/beta hydrolase n=1 Tax=Rhodococcus sp. IEGM 1379 TaxID=3047086 RepID=UPI0024B87097|nr:alpha/beta hydrolase [Rhodococcus sp. IEGM 1379]MDI9916532.1 alpha/beta hydrolase [Rhodococcus sp. IEGM 1379]